MKAAIGIGKHPYINVAGVARIDKFKRGIQQSNRARSMTGKIFNYKFLIPQIDFVSGF